MGIPKHATGESQLPAQDRLSVCHGIHIPIHSRELEWPRSFPTSLLVENLQKLNLIFQVTIHGLRPFGACDVILDIQIYNIKDGLQRRYELVIGDVPDIVLDAALQCQHGDE